MSENWLYQKCCECSDNGGSSYQFDYVGCNCPYLEVTECESESIRAYMCGEMDDSETSSPPNVYKKVKSLYRPSFWTSSNGLPLCNSGCLNMADRFIENDPYYTKEYEREVVAIYDAYGNFLYNQVECDSETDVTMPRCQGVENGGSFYTGYEEQMTSATLCVGYSSLTGCYDRTDLNVTINGAKQFTTINANESTPYCTSSTTKEGSVNWSQDASQQCIQGDGAGAPTILSINHSDSGTISFSSGSSSSGPSAETKYDWEGDTGCDLASWDETHDETPDFIAFSEYDLGNRIFDNNELIDHGNLWNSDGKIFSNPDSESSAISDSEGTIHEDLEGNECTSVHELRVSRLDFLKRESTVNITAYNLVKGLDYTACYSVSKREAFAMSDSDLETSPNSSRGAWSIVDSFTTNFTAEAVSEEIELEYELPHERGYEYEMRQLSIFRDSDETQNCECPENEE